MGAMEPACVGVGVAFLAIIIHHERVCGDEVAGGGASFGGVEIFIPFFGSFDIPSAWVLGVEADHESDHGSDGTGPADSDLPPDLWSGESVKDVEPDGEQRGGDMSPIGGGSNPRVFDLKKIEARESDAGKEQ